MNEKCVFDILENHFHENKLSHAYLIETNNIEKCLIDLKKSLNLILNGSNDESIKHLIEINNFPGLLIFNEELDNIKKDTIELIKEKMSVLPVFSSDNIYILLAAEKMNDTAFNKLLKFLEEPEDHIIGFLITTDKSKIADTIISRCELIKAIYDISNGHSDNALKAYNLFLNSIGNISNVCYNNIEIKKLLEEKKDLSSFLRCLLDYYKSRINHEFNNSNLNKCKIVEKYINQVNYNVNSSLLIDSLFIELDVENE